VAARRTVHWLPRVRSNWTTEATPRSSPAAVAGYQGLVSFEIRLGTFGIFDCRFLIFDCVSGNGSAHSSSSTLGILKSTLTRSNNQKSKIKNRKCSVTIRCRVSPRSKFPLKHCESQLVLVHLQMSLDHLPCSRPNPSAP